VLIFGITELVAETVGDSLRAEGNSEEDRLGFSLDLTPVDSQTLGQLALSQLTLNEPQLLESRPFVLTEVTTAPSPNQNMRSTRPGIKIQNSLYATSLITLTALNVADYLSTVQALKHEELEEVNPITKPLTKNIYLFTAVKLGVAALDICILKNLYKKNKPLAWVLSLAANFAMSYVVANNIKMIREVQ
jgi:hypothetical protein